LPAGAWVDRLPRRLMMLVGDIASLVALLTVPVAAWADLLTIWHLLVVALVLGTANVFFTTAYSVYVPGIVSAEQDLRPTPRCRAAKRSRKSPVRDWPAC